MITIRLKEVAKQKGYTLTDISRATRISMNTLSVLGRGDSNGIQFDTLDKICNFLNVTPSDIIELSPDKYVVEMPMQQLVDNQAIAFVYSEADAAKMQSVDGPMLKIDDNNQHRIAITRMNSSKENACFFVGLPMARSANPSGNSLMSKKELVIMCDWLRGLNDDQKKSICNQSVYLYRRQFSDGDYPSLIFAILVFGKKSSALYPFRVEPKSGELVDLDLHDVGPVHLDD